MGLPAISGQSEQTVSYDVRIMQDLLGGTAFRDTQSGAGFLRKVLRGGDPEGPPGAATCEERASQNGGSNGRALPYNPHEHSRWAAVR